MNQSEIKPQVDGVTAAIVLGVLNSRTVKDEDDNVIKGETLTIQEAGAVPMQGKTLQVTPVDGLPGERDPSGSVPE